MLRARIQKMNLERAEEFAAERNPRAIQPRSQGFSLEDAPPTFKGKALGTRLRAILPNEKVRGQGSLA